MSSWASKHAPATCLSAMIAVSPAGSGLVRSAGAAGPPPLAPAAAAAAPSAEAAEGAADDAPRAEPLDPPAAQQSDASGSSQHQDVESHLQSQRHCQTLASALPAVSNLQRAGQVRYHLLVAAPSALQVPLILLLRRGAPIHLRPSKQTHQARVKSVEADSNLQRTGQPQCSTTAPT